VPVADQLGAGKILFPPDAGTQSAWGMLFAHVVQDVSMACLCRVDAAPDGLLQQTLDYLVKQAGDLLDRSGIAAEKRRLELVFDMRYPGQGWELTVAAPTLSVDDQSMRAAADAFHQLHQDRFAHNDLAVSPELVTMRIRAIGLMDMPDRHVVQGSEPHTTRTRHIYVNGAWQDVAVINRAALAAGQAVDGPAIVEDPHSTILLTADWKATLHESGVLIAVHKAAGGTSAA
jgi:N-methylhydantoinase A